MFIESYKYIHGSKLVDGAMLIPELRRDKYMTAEYMKLFPELYSIDNRGKTALLYLGGPASHHSDIRNINQLADNAAIAIKGQLGFTMYNIARLFKNIEYVNINANTCASAMHAIHEARTLLSNGFDDVIIYGEEKVDASLKELFKQLGIDIMCGDAVAIMHLTKEQTLNSKGEIRDTAWLWNMETSPMTVSAEGYTKLVNSLDIDGVSVVKPHGTGTLGNNPAEGFVLDTYFKDAVVCAYKSRIGHTQGVSGLIEIGLLLDEGFTDKKLVCMASGLGGFYGGCVIKV